MTKKTMDPAWLTDPRFQGLTPLAEVLMHRMYNAADGMGRLALGTMKTALFPTGVRFEPDQWHKAILELEAAGIICSYAPLLADHTFMVYQLMVWRQGAGRSKFADPPAGLAARVVRNPPKMPDAPAELVVRDDEIVVWMPATGNVKVPIRAGVVAAWAEAFPAVDVVGQLRQMVAWCGANPSRVKTPQGVPKFIFNWLSKEQNAGRPIGRGAPPRTTPIGNLKASLYSG